MTSVMTESVVSRAFVDAAFRGRIIRYATLLEYALEGTLALYFVRPERIDEIRDLLLTEIQLGRKIELLQKLPIPASRSKSAALDGLRAFQRLRNVAAHRWHVKREDARELLKNTTVARMIANPETFETVFRRTRRGLERIRRTRAFGPDATSAARAVAEREFMAVFL